jgi:hypothetical protein
VSPLRHSAGSLVTAQPCQNSGRIAGCRFAHSVKMRRPRRPHARAQWEGEAGSDQAPTRRCGAGADLLCHNAGVDRRSAGHRARGRAAAKKLPAATQPATVATPARPARCPGSACDAALASGPARPPGHRPGPRCPGQWRLVRSVQRRLAGARPGASSLREPGPDRADGTKQVGHRSGRRSAIRHFGGPRSRPAGPRLRRELAAGWGT